MSTYFICLAAYLTGWPIVQFLAWPMIHRGWLAAKEHETRLQVAEEMVKLLTENGSEIDRLRAIVAKLPVTADGVPVVPEMTVWPRGDCWIEDEQGARVGMELLDIATGDRIPVGDEPYDKCYSTREAAEAKEQSK